MLNPKKCNIAYDAHAIDRDGSSNDARVDRFEELVSSRNINVVVPGGVRQEILHRKTPIDVKVVTLPQVFNLRPSLNTDQQQTRNSIAAILQGNAHPSKHTTDTSHLSEAAETGCAYFITHDKRMLHKRTELQPLLGTFLHIVTLDEFLKIYDTFESAALI